MEQILTKTKHNNSINSINIFRKNGFWVFNDEEVGLLEEPFVAGADTLIDKIVGKGRTVQLIFSSIPFPGSMLTLNFVRGKINQGTDYHCVELDHNLWLCPALGKYFKKSPKVIYIQYKN